MPRISGVKERRDKIWYDTNAIEPGQGKRSWVDAVRFFGNKNIGDDFLTNLQCAGTFGSDSTYICLGIGVRLIGEPREQEDLLLDHLRFSLVVGDHNLWDGMGPHLSMLRHVYTKEEIEQYMRLVDEPPTEEQTTSPWQKYKPGEIHRTKLPPHRPPAYLFGRAIVIPVRQHVSVTAQSSDYLPRAVVARVHLFGLQTRDIV